MRILFTFFILISLLHLSAQVNDNFTDGDFSLNPVWSGDVNEFKINTSNELQLNSSGTDTSMLTTENYLLNNTQWEFWIKQSFNSSSNNYTRVYLTSNSANLKGNINGYFIQIGSTLDDITLNRQDGSTITALISGSPGITANSTNTFSIKATHNLAGEWELFYDPTGNSIYQSIGTATDQTYISSNYFGVFCKYTSSNSTKVYFDNFLVQTIQVDTFPPVLTKIEVENANLIHLLFNEAIDTIDLKNISNYLINNNIGQPVLALPDLIVPSIAHLQLQSPLQQGNQYTITVANIKDLNGNIMAQTQKSFSYYEPRAGDLVFNEIMADPTPIVGLPDAEYIEIYNQSNFPVSLKDWSLTVGTKKNPLPDTILNSKEYLIICHDDNYALLSTFGKTLPLASFSLVNTGAILILTDKNGGLINVVEYSASWYGQSSKAEGGWALERIDATNICGGSANWWASNDAAGGTPGRENSIANSKPDLTSPLISRIAVLDSVNVRIKFTESMDSASILNPNAYEIHTGIGNPISVTSNYPFYNQADIQLNTSLLKTELYKLQVVDSLYDCNLNLMQLNTTTRFGMAEKPEKFDLVINEILFDPKTDGYDFVEIYNRSDKIIDISGLRLANYDFETIDFTNLSIISEDPISVFPGEYFVLTQSSDMVKTQYYCKNPNNFIEMTDFPTMSNTDGNIFLIKPNQEVLDSLVYSDEMHFVMLKNYDGVSLERIDFDAFTTNNWHSASQASGFGTPTYLNSQYAQGSDALVEISISPTVFSPDNDGYNDVLNIEFNLPVGTILTSVLIFDTRGKEIKNLRDYSFQGTTGRIIWDGTDNHNSIAQMGIYIALIETLHPNGTTTIKKFTFTLSGRI